MAIAPRDFRASRDDPRLRNRAGTSELLDNQVKTENPNQSDQEMREQKVAEEQIVQPERDTPASRQQARQEAQEQIKKGFPKGDTRDFLSEEQIAQSYNLQKLGAEPGDRITDDNKLERLVSPEPAGEVITAYDIEQSPNLQSLGAEPGDLINDERKLVKSGKNDPIKNILYSYGRGRDIIESTGDLLRQYVPIPDLDITAEQWAEFDQRDFKGFLDTGVEERKGFFDSEFIEGTPEERRLLQEQYEEEAVAEIAKDFDIRYDTFSGKVGTFAGEAGPAAFVPLTAGTRMGLLMAEGAVFGVGDLVVERLAETGELPSGPEVGETAAISSAGGGGASLVIRGGKRIADDIGKGRAKKKAREIQEDFEESVNNEIALGTPPAQAAKDVQNALGISDDYLAGIARLTGRKAKITGTKEKAKETIQNRISNNSATARQKSSTIDKWLGAISTRIENISPAARGRLRTYEANIHFKTANKIREITPFVKMYNKAPKRVKEQLDLHILNGDFNAARGLFKTFAPNDLKLFDDALDVIKRTGDELQQSGYKIDRLKNYFPRVVKDLDGLRASLGREKKSLLDKALSNYADSKKIKISKLTIDEKTEVVDRVLRGQRPSYTDGKLSFTKPRSIEKITPEQLKFYNDPSASLQEYVKKSVNDIEKRKFFGKAATDDDAGYLNTQSSIGKFVTDLKEKNAISIDGEQELQDMLSARFGNGERGPNALVGTVRDIGYSSTIANPYTALVNIDELFRSAGIYGFTPTLRSVFGKKYLDTIQLGIKNASKEMDDPGKAARVLRGLFKASGFTKLDQIGKNVQINAALRKNFAKAQTAKGRSELRKKYQAQFGDETESLIENLQQRNVTDNTKVLAFSDLSDMQPISRSEMSEKYLQHPNGRIAFQLKSFTLKQYDLVRNQIVKEFKQGSKVEAAKRAAVLMSYMTASGVAIDVVRDMMLGREVKAEDIPERAMWALIAPYGMNEYLSDRYFSRGELKAGFINIIAPATPLIDDFFSLTFGAVTGEEDLDEEAVRALNSVPVVGKLLYNWFGGGAEAWNEREEQRREEE